VEGRQVGEPAKRSASSADRPRFPSPGTCPEAIQVGTGSSAAKPGEPDAGRDVADEPVSYVPTPSRRLSSRARWTHRTFAQAQVPHGQPVPHGQLGHRRGQTGGTDRQLRCYR
jgi:hypothetical protein